jgi:ABC-type Fe3+-siderophore transport system permease subunit
MKSVDIIGLITYILGWGVVLALLNENMYLLFKFSGATLAGYLIFIIIQQNELQN